MVYNISYLLNLIKNYRKNKFLLYYIFISLLD